jgi:ferric-dicitrate binding protein FerR (iron transport regulator)
MPEPNDEQFEKYLKNFRPVDPEPLPVRTKKHAAGANRRSALAATAVAGLAAVALVVIMLPHTSQPTPDQAQPPIPNSAQHKEISISAVTRLALDDRTAFNEFMTQKVQTQFPAMNSEQSTLRILARE